MVHHEPLRVVGGRAGRELPLATVAAVDDRLAHDAVVLGGVAHARHVPAVANEGVVLGLPDRVDQRRRGVVVERDPVVAVAHVVPDAHVLLPHPRPVLSDDEGLPWGDQVLRGREGDGEVVRRQAVVVAHLVARVVAEEHVPLLQVDRARAAVVEPVDRACGVRAREQHMGKLLKVLPLGSLLDELHVALLGALDVLGDEEAVPLGARGDVGQPWSRRRREERWRGCWRWRGRRDPRLGGHSEFVDSRGSAPGQAWKIQVFGDLMAEANIGCCTVS